MAELGFYDEDEILEPIVTFSFDNPPTPIVTDEKVELQPEFIDEPKQFIYIEDETPFIYIGEETLLDDLIDDNMKNIEDNMKQIKSAREDFMEQDFAFYEKKIITENKNRMKKEKEIRQKEEELIRKELEAEEERIKKSNEDPYHFIEETIKNLDNELKTVKNKDKLKYLTDYYYRLNPDDTGLTDKFHKQLDEKLAEYMIANNILDKKLIEEEIKFSREPSNIFTIVRDAIDDPSLIQNKKDFNKLVNTLKLVEKNIGDVSFTKFIDNLFQKKKNNELNAEEKFILNNVKRDGLTNFINKRLNVLEELFPEYTYPRVEDRAKKNIISDTIKSLRELEQKTGKQFNILLQGEKVKKADKIDQEQKINSIKEINKKVKIHKTRPIFIFGNKKDISTHFNIGNSIQVCRFINNAIEFHIITKTLRESDLNVLSYLLSKGKGVLYSKNKKKLGNLTDDDSIQKLIKRNIDFEKDINIFLAIPEKVGGGIGPIHNNHGLIDLLRNKLRKF